MSLSSWCARAAPGIASARAMHASDAAAPGAKPPTLATAYVAALAFIGTAHEADEHVDRGAVLSARNVLGVGGDSAEVAGFRNPEPAGRGKIRGVVQPRPG